MAEDLLSEHLGVEHPVGLLGHILKPSLVVKLCRLAVDSIEEVVFAQLIVGALDGVELVGVVGGLETVDDPQHFEKVRSAKSSHLLEHRSEIFVRSGDELMSLHAAFLQEIVPNLSLLLRFSHAEHQTVYEKMLERDLLLSEAGFLEDRASQDLVEVTVNILKLFFPSGSLEVDLQRVDGHEHFAFCSQFRCFQLVIEVLNTSAREWQVKLKGLIDILAGSVDGG